MLKWDIHMVYRSRRRPGGVWIYRSRRNRDAEPNHEPTEMKANGKRDGRYLNAATFPLGHGACHLKRAKIPWPTQSVRFAGKNPRLTKETRIERLACQHAPR
jgi:hypothetical protein